MPPFIPKNDFVGLEGIAHLCTGSEGRIPASTHVYNEVDDVSRFLEALDAVTGRVPRARA